MSVEDLQCCAPKHTIQDIFLMEATVTVALDWRLCATTAHHFVHVLTRQLPHASCERVMHYAKLLLNAVDCEYSCLRERRSVVALAIVAVSLEIAGVWHPHLASYIALSDKSRIDRQKATLLELCHTRKIARPPSPDTPSAPPNPSNSAAT